MTKTPIILKDYRVNFINWHPDTLAEEKSIDGELQGHIMHFKLEFKGRVVILGLYYWTCEYKPGAWQPEEKWYFTDELEINAGEDEEIKINMKERSGIFSEKEEEDICGAIEKILYVDGLMEERGIEDEGLIGNNINL